MAQITLLDGGMGQELVRRSGQPPTPLWSTQIMADHPGLVAAVHADYRASGATVHSTNTYAIHHDRLAGTALEGQMAPLIVTALQAAQGSGRIAGTIGPLVASYRPDLHPDHAIAVPLYAEIARLLTPQVDLIICETVASVAQARAMLAAALPCGKPVWLAVTVDDEDGSRLRSGEPVADVLAAAQGASALLANCAAPEAMAATLEIFAKGDLPFGAYANGFTQITKAFLQDKPTVDALHPRRDLGPDAYAAYALGWIDQGATIVGGCCEVGPAHIARLASALRDAGHTLV